jgi:sugar phosphate isomerase/epimerase
MRFGIMAMQLGALIPADLTPAAVPAHIAGFDHAKLVRDLHSRGFDPVELGGDLSLFMPHTFAPPAIEKLAALKAETGLSYTVHLALWSAEPSTLLEPVRLGTVQAMIDGIRATLPLDPEVYVMHATGALAAEFYRMRLPETARALILRQFQARAMESLRVILAETGIPSRKLAIETIEFPFELTLEMAEALNLSMCLDTGHVLSGFSGPIDLFDAVEKMLPRLAEVHLHDSPRWTPGTSIAYGQDHQALGQGDLDLGRLLDRLDAAGFAGPLVLELTVPEALSSLQTIRDARPALIKQQGQQTGS